MERVNFTGNHIYGEIYPIRDSYYNITKITSHRRANSLSFAQLTSVGCLDNIALIIKYNYIPYHQNRGYV